MTFAAFRTSHLSKATFDPQNILVINFGQLGDVILSLPALKAVRERFPDARITLLIGKPGADVVRIADVSNDQIVVDRVELRDGNMFVSVGKIFRLVKELRRRKFDFVIDLHSLSETNIFGFLSGAKWRLYANRDRRSLDRLSNFPVKPPVEDRSLHHTDRYLAVLEALGITGLERTVRIVPPRSIVAIAESFVKKHGIENKTLVGLFLGAGHPTRRWSIDNFVEVADRLSREPKTRVLVFLGPEESNIRHGLTERFSNAAIVVDEMPLGHFIAMLGCLKVLVAGDTGPMHLGAAVGAGVVLLSELGSPSIFRPLIDKLIVIEDRPLAEITVDQVENAVIELLS